MTPIAKKSEKTERVFLFTGSDDYTSAQKVSSWVAAFEKKYSASAVVRIDFAGDENAADTLVSSLETGGLFSSTKLIVAQSLFVQKAETHEPVVEALASIPDDAFVIFWE